jgi:hypothetical protein
MKQFFKKAMNWGPKIQDLADFFSSQILVFTGEGKNAFFKAPVRHKVALLDLSLWVVIFKKHDLSLVHKKIEVGLRNLVFSFFFV